MSSRRAASSADEVREVVSMHDGKPRARIRRRPRRRNAHFCRGIPFEFKRGEFVAAFFDPVDFLLRVGAPKIRVDAFSTVMFALDALRHEEVFPQRADGFFVASREQVEIACDGIHHAVCVVGAVPVQ